eukprot:9046705-Pyramimonas_sp.AAC.1
MPARDAVEGVRSGLRGDRALAIECDHDGDYVDRSRVRLWGRSGWAASGSGISFGDRFVDR